MMLHALILTQLRAQILRNLQVSGSQRAFSCRSNTARVSSVSINVNEKSPQTSFMPIFRLHHEISLPPGGYEFSLSEPRPMQDNGRSSSAGNP